MLSVNSRADFNHVKKENSEFKSIKLGIKQIDPESHSNAKGLVSWFL